MKRIHTFSALAAATVFGAAAMAAQMLLLRRFLWSFDAVETGVSLFFASWLLWTGLGSAAAATRVGRCITGGAAPAVWLLVAACAGLYFTQYELLATMRSWLGVPGYERVPLPLLAAGCLLANAPFCLVAGLVVPAVCQRLDALGEPVSRAFAWEALGAALGGVCLTALLVRGVSPDPRDESEWFRYFPKARSQPERFETGAGTTFTGTHGGTFYALAPGGVSELLPEGDRAVEIAALVLSQRPYAKEALLLGRVPLAAGVALARFRPDLPVTWCPCDAAYGARVVERARAAGLVPTNVWAAGVTPQALLSACGDGAYDAVVVAPPPATALAGASWRQASFARAVRRVTRRTGVGLFGLDCESAAVTPEKAALLSADVMAARIAWPEGGVVAAGAGGWWVAAQVPRLAYGAEEAAARFAMLKRTDFSSEAVLQLYGQPRAARLAEACSALNPSEAVRLPEAEEPEAILAAGLCDAVRQAWPASRPGAWLEWLRAAGGVRLAGLALIIVWMAPVALGGERYARRRLVGAWVAACGALGLAASLAVLYRLQMAFGSLYLMAGVGSCLYLSGLFCGNRLTAALAARVRGRDGLALALVCGCTVALAAAALGATALAACATTAVGLVCLCFAVGCAAGAVAPLGLEAVGGEPGAAAPVLLCADACGAALAGLAFAALVPLAGLAQAVSCFAALACGAALCVLGGSGHARLTAGLALIVSLTVLGGRVNALRDWSGMTIEAGAEPSAAESARSVQTNALPGIPRRLDLPRIREQLARGQLATNAAAYWE